MNATSSYMLRLALVIAIFGAFFFVPQQPAEAVLWCRADPVVLLSNGVTLDIGASVSTFLLDIKTVHYELHAPVGVSLVTAIYTPGLVTLLGLPKESFSFYADQPAGQYKVVTTVDTRSGNAQVIADTTFISPEGLNLGVYTTPGVEDEPITLVINN